MSYQGNVKTISGHFRKSDLIAEHGLNVGSIPMMPETKYIDFDRPVTSEKSIREFRILFQPFSYERRPFWLVLSCLAIRLYRYPSCFSRSTYSTSALWSKQMPSSYSTLMAQLILDSTQYSCIIWRYWDSIWVIITRLIFILAQPENEGYRASLRISVSIVLTSSHGHAV